MYKILYIVGGYYIHVPYIHECLFTSKAKAESCLKGWLRGEQDSYMVFKPFDKRTNTPDFPCVFDRVHRYDFDIIEVSDV